MQDHNDGLVKKDVHVTPVRYQWSYVFLVLTHRIGVWRMAKENPFVFILINVIFTGGFIQYKFV